MKEAQAKEETNTYTQTSQKIKQGNLCHLVNNTNSVSADIPNIMQVKKR
jgi:hypothetical protein